MVSLRRFVKGIFAGGIVGYVLGLLFAPQKGDETRRQLKEKGFDLKDKFGRFSDEVKGKITEIKDIAKKNFSGEEEVSD
jgi:gas vesicle protein